MEFTAQQIAQYVGGTVEGNAQATISTFAKIEEGTPGALSFFFDPKYEPYVYSTEATVLLVPDTFQPAQPVKPTLVRVASPREALSRLLQLYASMQPKRTGIDPLAYVAPTATIGKDVYLAPFAAVGDGAVIGDGTQLHPHATVGANARVGADCTLYANTTVYHDCIVGNRCVLHAGSVVGADGFGFTPVGDHLEKIPQIGIAELEDDVELGANSCVDRATMGRTIVRRGSKIDNLVQVAHNVDLGANTILCAQVGIAGSTKVGEWCLFAGQVGVPNGLTIADHVTLGAKRSVTGSLLKPGETYMGYPHLTPRQWRRGHVIFRELPELATQVRQLQKQVEALQAQLADKA